MTIDYLRVPGSTTTHRQVHPQRSARSGTAGAVYTASLNTIVNRATDDLQLKGLPRDVTRWDKSHTAAELVACLPRSIRRELPEEVERPPYTAHAAFSVLQMAMQQNQALLNSAWITLRVAAAASTLALILGTLAGVVLARRPLPGRTLFAGMVSAPLVMPEVILGLSLLLLFVSLGVDRGFWTIVAAHTTFAMCYVAVVVQSRLLTFDRTLEEAAMDLGAPPFRTFLLVTLPIIAPALGLL